MLYDPDTNSWTGTGSLAASRQEHASAVGANGKPLLVGGADPAAGMAGFRIDSERSNPGTGTFSPGPPIPGRLQHADAIALADGRVMVSGGADGNALSTVMAFQDDQVFNLANLPTARFFHASVVLNDGSVLVAGGISAALTDRTEIWNPSRRYRQR